MMTWFMANGRNHLLKGSEPLEGVCGIQPIMGDGQKAEYQTYDPVSEVPPDPCRPCLMEAAVSSSVIDAEPLDFARGRGVIPVDESDVKRLGLT